MEDPEWTKLILPLLLLSTSLAWFLTTFILGKPSINLAPGPRPWPIVGNLFQLGKNTHSDLANLARTHGRLFSLKLGTQLTVVASSPAAATEILKTHDRFFSARYVPQTFRIKKYTVYSLPWSVECDEKWKEMRTVCKTELFTNKMLDLQAHMREEKVSQIVKFSFDNQQGEVVKIGELTFRTVFNILGNVIFSRDVFHLADKDDASGRLKNHISRIMEVGMAPNLADFYPVLAGLDLQGLNRETATFVERIFDIWDGLILERKETQHDSKHDLLKMLISVGFSDLQLKALISDMFVAGTDTTTTAIEWTMSELVKKPQAMKRIRDELDVVVGKRKNGENAVTESHLVHLSYLQACVKETLRLHPPVPLLLPRKALDMCEVMNYTIPKDCKVFVNVWAIGRDPETWKDPLKFSPERFLESSPDYKGNDFEFTPFGAGRRICPGLPLASHVVHLIVASFIHSFDWSLPHGMHHSHLSMDERILELSPGLGPLLRVEAGKSSGWKIGHQFIRRKGLHLRPQPSSFLTSDRSRNHFFLDDWVLSGSHACQGTPWTTIFGPRLKALAKSSCNFLLAFRLEGAIR
ncbi:putative (S)-N-methylcoclaurine 3'-hydroxylase isozyme 2 [Tasmannia lanceolata]|uniref:putative (S)-N-methylcoclaurine 3'-hydroxylase isozyme 2 n=1 Tax=Tasmannia lanceolata TaxID=3420 RepID=UPI004062EC39